MKQPWKLAETVYGEVRQQRYEVAVLPLGATEPHNLHLPYGMDTLEGNLVGEKLCEAAWQRGAKVVLLPTIPYGTVSNQREFPLSLNVKPTTLGAVVTDLVESLVHQGIRKIVLLNSHGGNDLKWLLRELYGKTEAHLFLCNWYTVFRDVYHEIFEAPDDHAGEMETSLALAYWPELVARQPDSTLAADDGRKAPTTGRRLETSLALAYWPELVARQPDGTLVADDGRKAPTRFEAVNQGWVSITRPWHLLTTNAGAGNPHAATAEKGQQLIALLIERLAGFLVELSAAELDAEFPF